MKISIVGLFVKDLEGAKDFFLKYFNAEIHAYYEEDNGFRSYILKFEEGPKLELMTKPEIVDEVKNINRTGYVHICIKVSSIEKVMEITEEFRKDNYKILYDPISLPGKETRAIVFEDNIIEVSA